MRYRSIKRLSYSISILFHGILFILFLVITFSMDYAAKEYVELSFGNSNGPGSSGSPGTQINDITPGPKPQKEIKKENKSAEVKEVELPKAKNTSGEEVIKPADKEKEETTADENTKGTPDSKGTGEGLGNMGEGTGGLGFGIDWGGRGQRKLLYYFVPEYPSGVQKEADIRLKFTILPDGSVGTIIPLTKADTRLENSAINALRQWSFEPLSTVQKQMEQTAVIVFPYRLQ
ncbi:MAG TPA: energy transducer TonB [Ignavibacteriaceae bacterium]|nr:energy transducer TonB [Ignavibacteriaceae bacterium]